MAIGFFSQNSQYKRNFSSLPSSRNVPSYEDNFLDPNQP